MDSLPKINFETIPHECQRYPTTGDYHEDNGIWKFVVSKMGNADYEFLVLLHELVEWRLTQKAGISEETISAFDIAFEEEIKQGLHPEDAEPGDDLRAPYFSQHKIAEIIERTVANAIGVNWQLYERALEKLYK